MDRLTLKTKDLNDKFEIDGISLVKQFDNIQKFYGIPATLHNVDKNFHTHTFRDVLEAAAPTIDVLVKDNVVQVLDPKSRFMEDEEFNSLITMAEEVTGKTPKAVKQTSKFQKQAVITLDATDKDSFLGDVFARSWTVTRRAEGGISFSTDITRLACTNGLVIPDKQFSGFMRKPKIETAVLSSFHDNAVAFSVEDYLKSLFMHDGNPVPCSLADMLEMQKCLAEIADEDLSEMLFPVAQIKEFYGAQGIEVDKLARKYLDKLPTGLSYYQVLNILTNGAKSMAEKTIDNQVRVARFCQPKRMKNMKDVDLHWEGMPTFSMAEIHLMMGDATKKSKK
jgi:hypothetical protein